MVLIILFLDGVWRGAKLLNLKDIVDKAVAKCEQAYVNLMF